VKTYENNSIKWWTNVWEDVKPFDVLTNQEVYQKYVDVVDSIENYVITLSDVKAQKKIRNWNRIDEGSPADIVKRNKNRDSIYIPIPYQFYEDYMTEWLNTKVELTIKGVLVDDYTKTFELSLQDLKTHIKNNTKWSFDGSSDARSYNVYKTYKEHGVANPVFNNGEIYPKRSTHMTAYCFLNKSDVPILFKRPESNINRFLVQPNTDELPYFKGKYLTLDIDIKNKLVNFFLENEHIGVYKG
tara:strand:- start:443 stop:1171 length:729 start_codon:yes stop_codon:yes gene_type:complete